MPNSKTKSQTKKSATTAKDQGIRAKSRRLKLGARATRKEKNAVKSDRVKLSPAYKLFMESCRLLVRHRKLLGGILLVYAVLDLLLVGGASASSLQSTKSSLEQVAHGHLNSLSSGIALFAFMVNSSNTASSAAASAYQTMLLLLVSVIFIWALRQVYAGHVVRIRTAFYTGTYPIIPFMLVLLVIGVQLLPLVVGGALYSMLVGGGITVGIFEQIIALAIFLLLAFWSVYMITASVFALYVVTLPEMTPLTAIKSAKELVRFRRWIVFGKLVFLPFVLLVISAAILIPLALFVTSLATAVFFVLAVLALGVVHSYMYAFYRELL